MTLLHRSRALPGVQPRASYRSKLHASSTNTLRKLCLSLATAFAVLQNPLAHAATTDLGVDLSAVPFKNNKSSLDAGWEHGAFMEIFVRAYKDSNGDGIGDLRGITQSLDYLKDLGIKGIWLMPITSSDDHDHGYATVDYRGIETDYGNLADFDELLKEAHKRGIGIIIDYVINHSSAKHPLFQHSKTSPKDPYRDWYVWEKDTPTGWYIWDKDPWNTTPNGAYYSTFGGPMPDFNLRNPAVVKYHEDSLRFWLNRGLDGFRLDAVPHLIENGPKDWNDQPEIRALTNRLRKLITGYDNRHVVCEATANPTAYAAPEVCGSAFSFGHEHNIISAVKGDEKAIQAVADYFKTAPSSMAIMISNHDRFVGDRLWDQVSDLGQYRMAAATYLLEPGTPFIYYGEEIGMGMTKQLKDDDRLRSPMSWTSAPDTAGFTSGKPFRPIAPNAAGFNAETEAKDPNSILSFYKAMLKLRNTYPSIARGSYEHAFVSGKVMGVQRRLGAEHTLVLINYDTQSAKVAADTLPAGATLVARYPESSTSIAVDASGSAKLSLPAQSVAVYQIQPSH